LRINHHVEMRQILLTIVLILSTCNLVAQNYSKEYFSTADKADSLYRIGKYKASINFFNSAFAMQNGNGFYVHHYNAACTYALIGNKDSAFYQLEKAINLGYKDYPHVLNDEDFNSIHQDPRWQKQIDALKAIYEKAEAKVNRPVMAQLDSIHEEDQTYRKQADAIQNKYGWESKEIKAHWKIIEHKDSINLIKVKAILDKYGWMDKEQVGSKGNSTLFLVIQHADFKTQEHYLPMMRKAVEDGKAEASTLALLEDRVLRKNGKPQLYGSQIGMDMKTKTYYLQSTIDPDNLDKRRAKMGLQPITDYLAYWKIKWDVEQYKKNLPKIEEMDKEMEKEVKKMIGK
jgi:hypothetical protein